MNDRAVVITGAYRGLGRALAHHFSRDHDLVLNMLRYDSAVLDRFSVDTDLVIGDVGNEDVRLSLVAAADRRGASILINNAGVHLNKEFSECGADEIHRVIETNLLAPVLLTHAMWPVLVRNGGLVININSIAGKQGGVSEAVYCASKHGLAGFAKSLQFDATCSGVKVLSVFVGAMKTDMTADREDHAKLISPDEVAKLILDLCKHRDTLRVTEVDVARAVY